jgi:predicted transcriptional regulator
MPSPDVARGPLEEIEFLARSPNRVRVLDELARGGMDRRELEDSTGVARATLGRILDDFQARNWVIEDDRQYRTTQLGAYVSREFERVLTRFEPVPALDEVAQWFPEDGFGFDLKHLVGATIVRSTKPDALAPTAHVSRRLRTADTVRLATYSVLPGVVAECWSGTVERDLELEGVFEERALERFGADPRTIERAREILETGRADVYVADGDVPSTVFVVDEVVLLCLSGGEGAPLAVIETDDEAVLTWAEATIDDLRDEGERLDPSLFGA